MANSFGKRSKLLAHIDKFRANYADDQAHAEVELHLHHMKRRDGVFIVSGGVWVFEKFRPTTPAEIEASMKAGGSEELRTSGPPVWTGIDDRRSEPVMFMRAWLDHIQKHQAVGVSARLVIKDLHIAYGWGRSDCAVLNVVQEEGGLVVREAYELFRQGYEWDRKHRVLRRNAGRKQFSTPATISSTK